MVSEGSIAESLGMSRTPVREAFEPVQAEGWMRLYPKRGALIAEAQPHELEDVVDARVLIETDSVRRVGRDSERAQGPWPSSPPSSSGNARPSSSRISTDSPSRHRLPRRHRGGG